MGFVDKDLVKVDICCGPFKKPGFIGVDIVACPGVEIVCNLNEWFPFEDSSVDHLRAHDAIEHLFDKIKTMNEIYRVCKNGATVDIKVPSTDGRGAFQDPTHVSFWNRNSFDYYSSDNQTLFQLCKQYGFKGNFHIQKIKDVKGPQKIVHTEVLLKTIKN